MIPLYEIREKAREYGVPVSTIERIKAISTGGEMKEIKITLKTLTPLWTGDAWGDNTSIRPSSIMGSLRFWLYT